MHGEVAWGCSPGVVHGVAASTLRGCSPRAVRLQVLQGETGKPTKRDRPNAGKATHKKNMPHKAKVKQALRKKPR